MGTKAIFKKNKREAVIMSPEVYDALMDELFDYQIEREAVERLRKGSKKRVSLKSVATKAGLVAEDMKGWEDVEIE